MSSAESRKVVGEGEGKEERRKDDGERGKRSRRNGQEHEEGEVERSKKVTAFYLCAYCR